MHKIYINIYFVDTGLLPTFVASLYEMPRSLNILFAFFFLVTSPFCISQNLVPNPSFEQFTSCPDYYCQIHRATGWYAWGYTPDYFNSCGIYPWSPVSVPYNDNGFQFAATGNGYAAFFAYDSLSSASCGLCREYIGAQLISPLVIGQKYYVSLKVSLADIANFAVDKIGILFTTTSYEMDSSTACTNTNTTLQPGNYAQVYSTSVISDTANWTTISGSFIANAAYQYLSIGNHFDNTNSTHILVYNDDAYYSAYYYLDDVYVGTDSTESVNNFFLDENLITIFPNPFYFSATVIINESNSNLNNSSFSVYDLVGREMRRQIITNKKFEIERNSLPAGTYILQIKINNNIYHKKIIITN